MVSLSLNWLLSLSGLSVSEEKKEEQKRRRRKKRNEKE
jgi:hypothetical protein